LPVSLRLGYDFAVVEEPRLNAVAGAS
jgi:hypothetical protein